MRSAQSSEAKEGSPAPFEKTSPGRDLRRPHWRGETGRARSRPGDALTAIDMATGDIAWQMPRHHRSSCRKGNKEPGARRCRARLSRPAACCSLRPPTTPEFRGLDAKDGARALGGEAGAERKRQPHRFYQGRNGKQYVAIVATDTLAVYALP